jgi:NitT/TauT family transport system substrate-binding protein
VRGLALVGTAGLLGLRAEPAEADPPLETTKLRLFQTPVTCLTPQYVAEELLYDEGFTDVRYLKNPSETQAWVPEVLLSGEVDISLTFIPSDVMHIEAGAPVVILGGSHIGCIELVANNEVRSTRELKDKTVAVQRLRSDEQIFISMFVAHVGLDPQDINWIIVNHKEQPRLLAEGKIDALMAGPPEAQELRAKGIGHVLINTTIDKPWSEYFCCVVASTREFVRKHPVATKRAMRAIMKATDVCALAEGDLCHGSARQPSRQRVAKEQNVCR